MKPAYKLLFCAFCVCLVDRALPADAKASGGAKPNVIVIMADDIGAEGLNCYGSDLYGPPLLQREARKFVVYQNHTGYRSGLVKYVELDARLHPLRDQGKRHVLIDPVPDSPIENRYRGERFYCEGNPLYMYSGGGPHRIIVYATAEVDDDAPGKTDGKTGKD